MTYRRAAIPAVAGGLLLTALLWWAGASVSVLHLQGATDTLGGRLVADLQYWLSPWSYDPPGSPAFGPGEPGGADASRYRTLHATAMQIRFAALFAFFVPGALLLVRRLPPVNGRTPVLLPALWAWGMAAGALAATVSAPWLIASHGRGSYRVLPQLAGMASSGQQITVPASFVTAVVIVLVARITTEGAGTPPLATVSRRAARLAATVGTAVVALSLVVLSYESVAASIQTAWVSGGLLAEPGDLLRAWLLLGGWSSPPSGAVGGSVGQWALYRLADALVLVVVWWALRLLPARLTRASLPAMAVGGFCATVIGLLASQLFQSVVIGADTGWRWAWQYLQGALGGHVPAALTWGLLAGLLTATVLRLAGGHAEAAGTGTPAPPGPPLPPVPPAPPVAPTNADRPDRPVG
ncbi:hypothetical protein [Streptomyces sp. NPDC102409]|uniref:hypothetical protein n=1 Tax=Streptomyces sp. NPDC102409 TaxID=3366172 RepID=UPI0038068987